VVDVAVREHHGRHGLVAEVLACEGQRIGGRLLSGAGIDHDPARLALDERDVGQVEATQLPDAIAHLEQAHVVVEQGLTPQAGVDGGRRRPLDEVEGREIPDHPAFGILDLAGGRGDEAALGIREGGRIGQIGRLGNGGVGLLHGRRGG